MFEVGFQSKQNEMLQLIGNKIQYLDNYIEEYLSELELHIEFDMGDVFSEEFQLEKYSKDLETIFKCIDNVKSAIQAKLFLEHLIDELNESSPDVDIISLIESEVKEHILLDLSGERQELTELLKSYLGPGEFDGMNTNQIVSYVARTFKKTLPMYENMRVNVFIHGICMELINDWKIHLRNNLKDGI